MNALTGERLTLRDDGVAAQQEFQHQVLLSSADPCNVYATKGTAFAVCEACCHAIR